MASSKPEIVLLGALLEQALTMDPPQWDGWLARLPAPQRALVPGLRRLLAMEAPAAAAAPALRMPPRARCGGCARA